MNKFCDVFFINRKELSEDINGRKCCADGQTLWIFLKDRLYPTPKGTKAKNVNKQSNSTIYDWNSLCYNRIVNILL